MWRNLPDRKVITKFMAFTATGQIPLGYNSITLINFGSTTVTIGGVLPLAAGASIGWAHNQLEINGSAIDIDFPNGGTQYVVAIINFFADEQH